MLKVVLVEDDKLSLELLTKLLEKSFPDVTVAGGFLNPLDSLEFLENNYADIIITDVKMPEITGLELAQIATEKFPFIKIIFISAYEDFDTARKALNTNVVSYILKPVTSEKISSALESITKQMNQNARFFSFTSESLSEKRADFAKKLFDGKIAKEEIAGEFSRLGIIANPKSVQCLLINCKISNLSEYFQNIWKHEEENLFPAITNVINDMNTSLCFGIAYDNRDKEFSVLYFVDRDYREKFEEQLKKLQKTLDMILKIQISFYFHYSYNSVYSISKISENDIEKNLIFDKIFNNDKDYKLTAEKLLKHFQTPSELSDFAQKLAAMAIKHIDLLFFEKNSYNLYSYTNCKTERELIDYILKTSDIIQKYKKNKPQIDLFNKTMQYISDNYMNPITLEEISSYVGFSTWSFCKFFKKHTKKSFTDYLNAYRIEEALKILDKEPNIKINILSYRVGFPTSSNFYKNFKANTGKNPSEYLKEKSGE